MTTTKMLSRRPRQGRLVPRLAVMAAALAMVAPTAAVAEPPGSLEADPDKGQSRAAPRPFNVTADDLKFDHHLLKDGTPAQAQLTAEHLNRIPADLASFLEPSPEHPMYAGGVVLASRHGVVPVREAAGQALRYADDPESDGWVELPEDEQVPMATDTIFDLASVTKTFTTLAVLQQVEAGRVGLDRPVADYLPDFAANGKGDITIRDLLTHTGGLPPWVPLYSRYETPQERFDAVLATEPNAAPGEEYVYSDLGLITLGLVVEDVTGMGLDEAVEGGITGPLGMSDTMFNPPAELIGRIAATERQPWADRPMIRGEVHDENAWSLGGVAGHAGLFSTADDLAVLARTLLNGGRYGDTRILQADTVRQMLVNENEEFPGDAHGLGFELDQRWYMDGLSSPVTFGHTGYTGTSVVLDPLSDSFVILLTNRVHPSRDWGSNNPSRRAMARDVARALPVRPREGDTAWFSGVGDDRTVDLTAPAAGGEDLTFDLWYDTEAGYDLVTLEASDDGGSTWNAVPFSVRTGPDVVDTEGTVSGFGARRWHQATADLPEGDLQVRWRYDSDGLYQGRGVYVDAVSVGGDSVPDDAFTAEGWNPSAD